jgi:hypothetical protein
MLIMMLADSYSAFSFTLNTPNSSARGWDRQEVELLLNTTNCPAGVEDLIESAMDVWNGIESSNLRVKFGGYTTATVEEVAAGNSTEVPAIFCLQNMNQFEASLDPNSIPGYATGARLDGDGYINYGYIVLNAQPGARANISTFNSDIVKVVVAHEIGHLLGLGHSEDTKALMYYDASAKGKLGLAKDDVDGMTYLYPRNELGKDKIFGCSTIGQSGRNLQNSLVLTFILFAPLGTFLIRRRRQASL